MTRLRLPALRRWHVLVALALAWTLYTETLLWAAGALTGGTL